jgi:dienelactone hydrolase
VFRRYIERRERALHSLNDNRRALPFDWGLEHVGLPPADNPAASLQSFADRSVESSAEFYAHGAAPDNAINFDGEIVRFPSAVETPYPANNMVSGRFFGGDDRRLAVVVLPQWNCPWDGQIGLCRVLARFGIGALRLSLPYHHHRKPPELERAEYLVSPNIGRTLAANRQAVLDARRAADWLLSKGYRRVGILGTSIGSCIGFLTFVHDERFSVGAFIHVSGFFADVVWDGLSTQHVRQSLDGAISLESLRRLWSPISPIPLIPRLRPANRPMLMLAGRYDLSFPVRLTRDLLAELELRGIRPRTEWMPCGHYTMGKAPFSAIAGYRVVQFFRENREI